MSQACTMVYMKKGCQVASLALVKEPAFGEDSFEKTLVIEIDKNFGSLLSATLTAKFGIPSGICAVVSASMLDCGQIRVHLYCKLTSY